MSNSPVAPCAGADALEGFLNLKAELLVQIRELDAAARAGISERVGIRLTTAYWHTVTTGHGVGWDIATPPVDRTGVALAAVPAILERAKELGRRAARLEALDATFQIGSLYSELMESQRRASLGAFHTPPSLVRQLLDSAEAADADWRSASVLDPACGCGMFMVGVALRLHAADLKQSAAAFLATLPARLAGVELDPFSAWIAQVMMEAALLPLCIEAGTRLPVLVRTGDALELPQEAAYDVVIGNPPYGKVKLDAARRKRFERSLFGHANLYGLFIDLGVHLLRNGGVLAYIVPTSFLGGQYFKALRGVLASQCPLVSASFVESRNDVFEDVLQETLLAVFRKGGASAEPSARGDSPWILPRHPCARALTDRLAQMTGRLADYGYAVSTGPLVWNRHKEQLAYEPSVQAFPLVWAESVKPEGFELSAQRKNHSPWIRLLEGQHHLLTTTGCVVLQRTTAKEQSRRLMAGTIPEELLARHGGVVIENHLNVIAAQGPTPVSLETVRMLLSNASVDQAFRCISGSVAVSAYELESLPLPTLPELLDLQRQFQGTGSEAAFHRQLDALYAA
jgi:adenine-specific DNA-methyltransferase